MVSLERAAALVSFKRRFQVDLLSRPFFAWWTYVSGCMSAFLYSRSTLQFVARDMSILRADVHSQPVSRTEAASFVHIAAPRVSDAFWDRVIVISFASASKCSKHLSGLSFCTSSNCDTCCTWRRIFYKRDLQSNLYNIYSEIMVWNNDVETELAFYVLKNPIILSNNFNLQLKTHAGTSVVNYNREAIKKFALVKQLSNHF